jgi:hypothetical protein
MKNVCEDNFYNLLATLIFPGDLADAKEIDNMGSRQFHQEWLYYSDILKETHIINRTLWFDIRGNHGM